MPVMTSSSFDSKEIGDDKIWNCHGGHWQSRKQVRDDETVDGTRILSAAER
jgi:hypothetical protein